MSTSPQVVIVGAGAAGLAAGLGLARSGVRVLILEARGRIGGRMFTQQEAATQAPIELGAEFIHGRPPEIFEPLQAHGIEISEVEGESWCGQGQGLAPCDFFSEVEEILSQLDDRIPDESFLDFLHRRFPDFEGEAEERKRAKRRALKYVAGFNAADPAEVSVHWLIQEMRAEEKIEGDRSFRSAHGYSDLIAIYRKDLAASGAEIQLGAVVKTVRWAPGSVELEGSRNGQDFSLSAPQVLLTLPAGVLQAGLEEPGAVRFLPELPGEKRSALSKIVMGKVIRATLRFRERFWERLHPRPGGSPSLAKMGFLLADETRGEEDWFPTWWTAMPRTCPLLTGWAPFRYAERLSGQSPDFIREKALASLSRLLPLGGLALAPLLEDIYVHDWQNDPFTRGAYSYVAVGGEASAATLAQPLENTLFFAGEATDTGGNTGTVHGALASGMRAATQISGALA